MSYGKKLYRSLTRAFDAQNIYDDTEEMLQNEVNAALKASIGRKVIRIPSTGALATSASSSVSTVAYSDDTRITGDYEVVGMELAQPSYQTSDWTVTTRTSPGSGQHRLTVTGKCRAQTSLVFYLMRKD